MKNIDETIHTVFDRMEQYQVHQRKRNKVILSTAVSLGIVCIIGAFGIALGNAPVQPDKGANIQASVPLSTSPVSEPPVVDPTVAEPTENNVSQEKPTNNNIIKINQLASLPELDYFALFINDFVSMTKQEMLEYYGINVFADVPDNLTLKSESHFGIYRRNNGTGDIYHDVNDVIYVNEDSTRGFGISVAKGRYPYSFVPLWESISEMSTINGVSVGIGQLPDGSYYAEFMYQNVGFRLHGVGVSIEELESMISSLIK